MEGVLLITVIFIFLFCPLFLASELIDTVWSAITFLFPYACFTIVATLASMFLFTLLKGSKVRKSVLSVLTFFLVFGAAVSLFTSSGAVRAGVLMKTGDIKTALTMKMREANEQEVDYSALEHNEKAIHLKGCPVKHLTKTGSSLDNWSVKRHFLVYTARYIEDSTDYKTRKKLWTMKHSGFRTIRICRANEKFVIPKYAVEVPVNSVCVLEESGDSTLFTVFPREDNHDPETYSLPKSSPEKTSRGSVPWYYYFPLTKTDDNVEDTGILITKALYEELSPTWIATQRRYSRIVKDIESIGEL